MVINHTQIREGSKFKWPGGGLKKGGSNFFSKKKGGSNFFYSTLGGVKFFSRVSTRHARRARVTENALYRRLISILMPYKAIEVIYILL